MAKTIVGLFNTYAQAQQVKQALISSGFDSSSIKVVANEGDDIGGSYDKSTSYENTSGTTGTGVGDKIKHFFSGLTGGDDDVHGHYASGVNQGGGLLAVTTSDDRANEVAALLKQHGARDIDGNQQAAASGTPVYGGTSASTTGQTTIPVVEEELVVGKREVDRGGVRVYSHVVEKPVSADVNLRDEFINVERRFVDRPASSADFAAGTGNVIELNATGEEAVVGKSARVVEEVVVGKETSQRTEAIHDLVRKTEVDVEQVPGETRSTGYATTGTKKTDY